MKPGSLEGLVGGTGEVESDARGAARAGARRQPGVDRRAGCAGRRGDDQGDRRPPDLREPGGARAHGPRLRRGTAGGQSARADGRLDHHRGERGADCDGRPSVRASAARAPPGPADPPDRAPRKRRGALGGAEGDRDQGCRRCDQGGGDDHRGRHHRQAGFPAHGVSRRGGAGAVFLARLRGDPSQRRRAGGAGHRRLVRRGSLRFRGQAGAGRRRPRRSQQTRDGRAVACLPADGSWIRSVVSARCCGRGRRS